MIGTNGGAVVVRASALFNPASVVHGFAERTGGVSEDRFASLNLGPRSGDAIERVRQNRARLFAALGLTERTVLTPRQTHSVEVAVHIAGSPLPRSGVFEGDAVVTDDAEGALMILAADCVPVLLWDHVRRIIGAVHAGWRGTAGGIVGHAIRAMGEAFGCDPSDVRAVLGPAIGRCCYEVGPEVLRAVAASTPAAPAELWDGLPAGKGLLDLHAANAAQLRAAGVPAEGIDAVALCTACHTDRFFSHRREGEPTGRGGAVIALR